jgi:hypothetical protein
MGLLICDTFLADLRNHGDNGFAKRALSKILTNNGSFRTANGDHRFDGIDDAWIRIISRQKTAWRAIYIRRGEDVLLYRAGEHSIEDNLSAPAASVAFRPVQAASGTVKPTRGAPSSDAAPIPISSDRFLQNHRSKLLRNFMLGRRLIPHREIFLVSPTVSMASLGSTRRFGMVLDDLIQEGTKVTLITRPPASREELQPFVELETRGIKLAFHERLHAKLYLFEVSENAAALCDGKAVPNVAIIGSANLTDEGMGFGEPALEELCYELPDTAYEHAFEFVLQLVHDSEDLRIVRDKLTKGERRQ